MECEIHLKLGAPRESGCVPSLARAKISVGVAYSLGFGIVAACERHAHDEDVLSRVQMRFHS